MKITKHARLRMDQRGIKKAILDYMEYFLPQKYVNECNKIVLTKKIAKIEAKKIRIFADNLEKHAGTEVLLDKTGSDLITTSESVRENKIQYKRLDGFPDVLCEPNGYIFFKISH